jgi:Mrp family chromosome partitioning ATPase
MNTHCTTGGLGGSGRAGVVTHLAVASERRWEAAALRVLIGDGDLEHPTMRDVSGALFSIEKLSEKSKGEDEEYSLREGWPGRASQTLAVASERGERRATGDR